MQQSFDEMTENLNVFYAFIMYSINTKRRFFSIKNNIHNHKNARYPKAFLLICKILCTFIVIFPNIIIEDLFCILI